MTKLLLFYFLFIFSSYANTTLRSPHIKGMPLMAYPVEETYYRGNLLEQKLISATAACQLAGFNTAVLEETEVQLIAKAKTKYFDMREFVKNNFYNYYLDLKRSEFTGVKVEAPFILKPTRKNFFNMTVDIDHYKVNKVSKCEVASICRNHDSGFLLQNDLDQKEKYYTDRSTPFMRSCYNWGKDSNNVFVFTKLTCKGNQTAGMTQEFHEMTENKYLVKSSQKPLESLVLNDTEKMCSSELALGSLGEGKTGTCDYNPWVNRGGPPPILNMSNPTVSAILTGRLRKMPEFMPVCAKNILHKYRDIVLKTDFNLRSDSHISFCTEKTSAIQVTDLKNSEVCRFEAHVSDYMGLKTTLQIEMYGDKKTLNTCEELYQCFNTEELSCDSVNFCPALGIRQDSGINLPKYYLDNK